MRILICDDDITFGHNLKNSILDYFSNISAKNPEIVIYNNGNDLLEDNGPMDIVFLDVEMPNGPSGITIGNELKKDNNNIIVFIVTSYNEYLDDAMKFNVFRYLSKPLDSRRLHRNLEDAMLLYTTSVSKVAIETKKEIVSVYTSEIICVEAKDRRVFIYTPDNVYLSVHNMNYWEDLLLPFHSFFRTHRSYIVGMDYITSFSHDLIKLCDGKYHAYLTRRKYTDFKTTYLLYLESVR
ncbi:MAG: response regulator transcription factor [Lachnospiraceae bacterium]|nr:response regulator transcription factor [Lachnospiraceae bacterium]